MNAELVTVERQGQVYREITREVIQRIDGRKKGIPWTKVTLQSHCVLCGTPFTTTSPLPIWPYLVRTCLEHRGLWQPACGLPHRINGTQVRVLDALARLGDGGGRYSRWLREVGDRFDTRRLKIARKQLLAAGLVLLEGRVYRAAWWCVPEAERPEATPEIVPIPVFVHARRA